LSARRYEPGRGAGAGQGKTLYELRFPVATWPVDTDTFRKSWALSLHVASPLIIC